MNKQALGGGQNQYPFCCTTKMSQHIVTSRPHKRPGLQAGHQSFRQGERTNQGRRWRGPTSLRNGGPERHVPETPTVTCPPRPAGRATPRSGWWPPTRRRRPGTRAASGLANRQSREAIPGHCGQSSLPAAGRHLWSARLLLVVDMMRPVVSCNDNHVRPVMVWKIPTQPRGCLGKRWRILLEQE